MVATSQKDQSCWRSCLFATASMCGMSSIICTIHTAFKDLIRRLWHFILPYSCSQKRVKISRDDRLQYSGERRSTWDPSALTIVDEYPKRVNVAPRGSQYERQRGLQRRTQFDLMQVPFSPVRRRNVNGKIQDQIRESHSFPATIDSPPSPVF